MSRTPMTTGDQLTGALCALGIKFLVGGDPEANLRGLAKRHKELGGAQVNWLGTYQHAARVWLKGLELQNT